MILEEEIIEDTIESDELENPSAALIKNDEKVETGPDTEVRPAATIWTYYECVKNGPGFTIFFILFFLYVVTLGLVQGKWLLLFIINYSVKKSLNSIFGSDNFKAEEFINSRAFEFLFQTKNII